MLKDLLLFLDVHDVRTYTTSGTRNFFLLADINRSWFDPAHGNPCHTSVWLGWQRITDECLKKIAMKSHSRVKYLRLGKAFSDHLSLH